MNSIHQINHPGKEIKINFKSRKRHSDDYYFLANSNNEGVRLWNRCIINEKSNSHKRKFIEHIGKFIENIENPTEESGVLRFWGEYEGYSRFFLLDRKMHTPYWNSPYAVHMPFFYKKNINDQNTDPFIFGETFYYAVCKKANLKNLNPGDLILFGSEFGKRGNEKFYLDTLFVVDKELPSIIDNKVFDYIYIESTLNRIGLSKDSFGVMPIHTGLKFSLNRPNLYSFVPSRMAHFETFGRPVIDTLKYGLQKPGARTGSKSRILDNSESIQAIWKSLAYDVINQGFVLGTHFNKLNIFDKLPC